MIKYTANVGNVTRIPTLRERKMEDFARAFHARKGCQHTLIQDMSVIENIVSVLKQLPQRGAVR